MNYLALVLAGAVALRGLGPAVIAPGSLSQFQDSEVDRNIIPHATFDPEMLRAMERARSTLPRFFDLAESGIEGEYLLKFRLTGGERDEHLWMEVVTYDGKVFCGTIANDPLTPGYRFGDEIRLHQDDVEDWMVSTGTERYGGYTMRVLLKSMSPVEAELYRSQLRD